MVEWRTGAQLVINGHQFVCIVPVDGRTRKWEGGRIGDVSPQMADQVVSDHNRIAALEADLARATALLRRLVALWAPCRVNDGICFQHGSSLPCPVGEARAWLEQQEGAES